MRFCHCWIYAYFYVGAIANDIVFYEFLVHGNEVDYCLFIICPITPKTELTSSNGRFLQILYIQYHAISKISSTYIVFYE